jgi:hypothetical protein
LKKKLERRNKSLRNKIKVLIKAYRYKSALRQQWREETRAYDCTREREE